MNKPTPFTRPSPITWHSIVNALSIPLLAFLTWWTLDRVLTPQKWCPALEEFKATSAANVVTLRCENILIAQLDIAKVAVTGLIIALALSHIVSVVRDVKAGLELETKLGKLRVGEGAKQAARQVADAADEEAEEIAGDGNG